jgi:hypothetical protein
MITIDRYCRIIDGEIMVDGKPSFRSDEKIVKEQLIGFYHFLGLDYAKFFKMDNMAKAAFLMAEVLLEGDTVGKSTGLYFANSYSSLDTDVNYQKTIADDNYFPSPSIFVYTLPNIALGEICIRHKIYGENIFFVGKVFESSHIMEYALQAFNQTDLQNALVGWLDCFGNVCRCFAMLVSRNETGMELNNENAKRIIK